MSFSAEIGKCFVVPGNVAGGIAGGAMLLEVLRSVVATALTGVWSCKVLACVFAR